MAVLVTGGAGYVGSHMAHALLDRGEDDVVVLDNLSTGLRGLVPDGAHFVLGDVGDAALIRRLITTHSIDAIIHFAAFIVVPESVKKPLAYYANNTMSSRTLIETAIACGVKNFIFSSTAAVYGIVGTAPVSEMTSPLPINPYGRSKLMTEWMLEDAAKAHDFRYVALRYFNVAGADPHGRTGQSTPSATHLVKRACQVALGRHPKLSIYGDDFPTPDGTGVRDYVHVCDLVSAHMLALDHLRSQGGKAILNCGYGHGYSVKEVIAAVEKVADRKLAVEIAPRRAGDPPAIVADATRLKTNLNWSPQYDDLSEIVRTAYAWERHLNSA